MANEKLAKALDEQETKLKDLNRQINELQAIQHERDKVHALVSQMRHTMGLGPYVASPKQHHGN